MESTHTCASIFVYHSLGKTGQVLFLNACEITTIIQTKDNDCEGQGLVGDWCICNLMQWTDFNDLSSWSQPLRIIEAEWESDIAMFSVTFKWVKSFQHTALQKFFHWFEDARISASYTPGMRVKWFNQKQAEYGCLLTFLWIFSLQSVQSHNINKVALSRFSVVSIDDCPLGTVYFVHHNARLPLTGSPWLKFLFQE